MNETSNLALIPRPEPAPLIPITEAEHDNLRELWERRKAKNTYRAYASDWKQFQVWCFGISAETLPAAPATVARYLGHLKTGKTPRGDEYSTATIGRRLASISHFHREASAADPTKHPMVTGIMEGVRRSNAGKPSNAKAAVLTKHLRKGLKSEPSKPRAIRDRALLLIGFAGAFRRSELVGIDVEHLTFTDEGALRIALPKSKTNQHGEPESVWILPAGAHCPIRALRDWLRIARIESSAVFRSVDRHGNVKERLSSDAVAYCVKGLAKRAGLDVSRISAHSLRSGLVTQCFLNELPIELIQQQTRHRDVNTLLRYRREIEPQKRNVSASLGL